MTPAQQLALWSDKLRDVSAMGHHFATNRYDKDNYEAIQEIALAMLALALEKPLEELEPLRAPLFFRPTPLCVGDGAIIDENGRILLIRRADNGCWAMPGGALEVGETPAEGVVREALEETGVSTEVTALVGVHDSRLCGGQSSHHLYHFLFLCQPIKGTAVIPPSHAEEVLEMAWFTRENLPDGIDPGHINRITEAYRVWQGDACAYFDHPAATQT